MIIYCRRFKRRFSRIVVVVKRLVKGVNWEWVKTLMLVFKIKYFKFLWNEIYVPKAKS